MDPKLKTIPKETLRLMYQLIKSLLNDSIDESSLRIKQAFWNNYAFFAFIYGMLGCFGKIKKKKLKILSCKEVFSLSFDK